MSDGAVGMKNRYGSGWDWRAMDVALRHRYIVPGMRLSHVDVADSSISEKSSGFHENVNQFR